MKGHTIASALLEIRKDSRYLPHAFADFAEAASVNKFQPADKTILIFSDYSALMIDKDTYSVDHIDGITSDLIEIAIRLQTLPSTAVADIPAYLCRDLLKWLRRHE